MRKRRKHMKYNAKTCRSDLELALATVQKVYPDLVFDHKTDFDKRKFGLKMSKPKVMGCHVTVDVFSHKKRYSRHACWHVHGMFFDALLDINPLAIVTTKFARVSKEGGNWKDWVHASNILTGYARMASYCCECEL
jgi:hypothetical protein